MKEIESSKLGGVFYSINESRDADEKTKKICISLIKASENFTKPVYFTFRHENATDSIARGIHDMISEGKNTHLNHALKSINSEFLFSHCSGSLKNESFSQKEPGYYTIWLSKIIYDRKASKISVDI